MTYKDSHHFFQFETRQNKKGMLMLQIVLETLQLKLETTIIKTTIAASISSFIVVGAYRPTTLVTYFLLRSLRLMMVLGLFILSPVRK